MNGSGMETASNSERRYNTRFRGVPKSVFSYSKVGKKPGPKAKSNSPQKAAEVQNDVVKTGKKCNRQSIEDVVKESKKEEPSVPEVLLPVKTEVPATWSRSPSPTPEPEEKPLSNGIHHDPPSEDDVDQPGDLVIKTEDDEVEIEVEDKEGETGNGVGEIKSPFEKTITPKRQEFVISGGGSASKTVWITSKEKLSFNNCHVASYNPKSKMFRCVVCQAVGFMSRIGEHYLGTHCNAKVFQCPQCSYCSAWWRCVRNHMSKSHGVSNAPASMWKNQPLLDEIMQLLQNLKYSVDCEDRVVRVAENSGKKYICPKCPYATDRRDLYNRHENIHREEKPFQCYICHKLFNRADHVKKHFCRIHKDFDYDINLIRRLPSKRSRLPVTPYNGVTTSPLHQGNDSFPTPPLNSLSMMQKSSMPLGQSQLLNCLTSSGAVQKSPREEVVNNFVRETEMESPKENYQKSHSNLLSYLTRSNFPSKPPLLEFPSSSMEIPVDNYSGKRLQEGALAAYGFPRIANNLTKEFICPYCPWKTTDMWSLRMHTATHYNNACVLCNFRSTQESDLELHMWDCHRKRPCNKCSYLADSIIMLDAHIKGVHSTKPAPFRCRVCSQPFEIRSDMEAHCIFIHNQVLRECKKDGCDFCSTDPDVLDEHRRDKHTSASCSTVSTETPTTSAENKYISRTQCLYCGCDFADTQSLILHEVIFHENALQMAGRRPLDPYICSICSYSTPKQAMMMEHLRMHTGLELYCRAGDSCYFRTPYDTVLREHIIQTHCSDDGIVRCPHCGFPCSTRNTFITHYQEHHPFSCTLCEEVEHKHFISSGASYLDTTIAALFPFAKKVADASRNRAKANLRENSRLSSNDDHGINDTRRSRKQLKPRKVLVSESKSKLRDANRRKLKARLTERSSVHMADSNSFAYLYSRRIRDLARIAPLYRCRLCNKRSRRFRLKRHFLFHLSWCHRKRETCDKCQQTFRYRYQVLLHLRKEHNVRS